MKDEVVDTLVAMMDVAGEHGFCGYLVEGQGRQTKYRSTFCMRAALKGRMHCADHDHPTSEELLASMK